MAVRFFCIPQRCDPSRVRREARIASRVRGEARTASNVRGEARIAGRVRGEAGAGRLTGFP